MDLTAVQERAHALVGHTHLFETRLFESSCRHVRFPDEEAALFPDEVSVDLQSHSEEGELSAIYVLTAQTALMQELPGEEPVEVATYKVTYGALYQLDDDVQGASKEQREAFGQCVAALALWPFARAEIAHMASAMNSPVPILLPVLTQRDVIAES